MEIGTFKSYIGYKFGKLKVFNMSRKNDLTYAECVCDCGGTYTGLLHNIKKGKSSCGKCQAWNKNKYDLNFFETSSPERNYIFGLLSADGGIDANRITLNLKSEDKDILYSINRCVSEQNLVNEKNVKHDYPQHTLRINSKKIVEILSNFGIIPNKSKVFKVPESLRFDRDFWRGMIDGDGYISINNGKINIGICGTIDVCECFLDFCKIYTDTKSGITMAPSKTNNNFARCRINCAHALVIGHVLYDGATLKIKRKHQRFLDAVRSYDEKKTAKLDKTFMNIANEISTLSYAILAKVGAIIVDNQMNIVSIGYNGTPSGFDNSAEYLTKEGKLKTKPETLHAESNAIVKLSASAGNAINATMYVTLSPCVQCAKLIIQSGIRRVIYGQIHADADGMDGINLLRRANIKVAQYCNN